MVLTVRGKEFKIDFVSNYVQELFQKMVLASFDLVDNEKIDEAVALSKTDQVKAKAMLRSIEKERKLSAKDLVELRTEMIKEIVESNGYEYDAHWWSRRTSPEDVNDFLLGCVKKDIPDSKKQKKN